MSARGGWEAYHEGVYLGILIEGCVVPAESPPDTEEDEGAREGEDDLPFSQTS